MPKHQGCKQFFLLAALLLFLKVSFAQLNSPIERGFVITLEKDTLRGEFSYIRSRKLFKEVMFKADGEQTFSMMTPQSINGFFLEKANQFYFSDNALAKKPKDVFLQTIIQGELTLLRTLNDAGRSSFWALKDSSLVELKKGNDRVANISGNNYKIKDRPYIKTLTKLTEDCIKERFDFELTYFQLQKFGKQYAKCKSQNITTFSARKPTFLIGFTTGISATSISFVDLRATVLPYNRSNLAPLGIYTLSTIQEATVVSSNAYFGMSLSLLPASNKRLTFATQMNLLQRKWSVPTEGISIKNFYLDFAPTVQFNFLLGEAIQPYLDVGINIGLSLSSKLESKMVTREFVRVAPGRGSDTWPNVFSVNLPLLSKAEFKPTFYSPFVTAGLSFVAKGSIINCGYRFGLDATLSRTPLFDSNLGFQSLFIDFKYISKSKK